MRTLLNLDSSALPRRIILSRKGSDAAWGGRSSLRLGTELISLPIPESASRAAAAEQAGTGVRYRDLPPHKHLGPLHTHLRDIGPDRYVHLDPDLRPELRPVTLRTRVHDRERLFGQVGAAERHLRNQEVGPGDLFLFFGWFRQAVQEGGTWRRSGPDEHCLWGWLQVRESHAADTAKTAQKLVWGRHHPHIAFWERFDAQNRVYRAQKRLTFAPHLPGAGVFRWHPDLTLTRRCGDGTRAATRREWCLPGFFRRTGLTYNQVDGPACPAAPDRLHLSSAPIGQEFVFPANRPFSANERADIGAWLAVLFGGGSGV